VPEADPVAVARMKYEIENRTKPGKMTHVFGAFSSRPDMTPAAKAGTPPMEGYRPTIPASVPPAAANPGGLGTNEVSITQPGGDNSAIEKGAEVRSNPGGATEPAAAATAPAPAPTANTAKAPDPNDTAKQASMTPSEQKKAYKEALKKQTDAVKKAQVDRKKKEAQQAQAVKDQKKKTKQQQEQQKQDPKQPPAPTGGPDPATPPPAKQ
jgi:outer membrane protein assembly factor BamD